jgi:hypothetical protein
MKWFVFVDMAYYPYVATPVEADTPDEALRRAVENNSLSEGDSVYVAPITAVASGTAHGPERAPSDLLALQEEINHLRELRRNVSGDYEVVVESGSMKPEAP